MAKKDFDGNCLLLNGGLDLLMMLRIFYWSILIFLIIAQSVIIVKLATHPQKSTLIFRTPDDAYELAIWAVDDAYR